MLKARGELKRVITVSGYVAAGAVNVTIGLESVDKGGKGRMVAQSSLVLTAAEFSQVLTEGVAALAKLAEGQAGIVDAMRTAAMKHLDVRDGLEHD